MIEWSLDIQIIKPLASFEAPLHVEVEVEKNSSYCHEGRFHKDQTHWIILYTYSGEGAFSDEKKDYVLKAGSCLLCNPGDPDICYKYPEDKNEPWRFLWLAFNAGSNQTKCRAFYNQFGAIFQLPEKSSLIQHLESYRSYTKSPHELTAIEGAQLVMNIFSELSNTTRTASETNSTHSIVNKINTYLTEKDIQYASIANIAQAMNLSREHISRVFKENTGISLQQYIIQQKIKMASRLLLQTNLSIKQISSKLGFANQQNFTRAFRKHKIYAPNQYRKLNLEMII